MKLYLFIALVTFALSVGRVHSECDGFEVTEILNAAVFAVGWAGVLAIQMSYDGVKRNPTFKLYCDD